MPETVFVLGNGPSLRGVDLERLSGVPTIGMNAAYRHWERVGWYPTHYCCLDDELIASHHEAIAALLRDGLVATAFVTARILDFQPALRDDDRCVLFEELHRPSFDDRGRALGLSFVDHDAFRSAEPWKVTTGAYAVRYAVYLGYRRLYLLGIDCSYVDAELEAQPAGGLALELTRTPDANPNYFFDDYQRAGDRYQVPNPPIYGDNLHLQSLELVRDDFARAGVQADIAVTSRRSELVVQGVFPYVELGHALGDAGGPVPHDAGPLPQPSRGAAPQPPAYDRVYLWAKTRSNALFHAGRLTMRVARALRAPVRPKGRSPWR